MASPKLALLWEIQITCLSDTNVVRQPETSRGGIPPLGPIWVKTIRHTVYPVYIDASTNDIKKLDYGDHNTYNIWVLYMYRL